MMPFATGPRPFPSRHAGRSILVFLVVFGIFLHGMASAAPTPSADETAASPTQSRLPQHVAPGLNVGAGTPEPAPPSVLGRWWFWTAVSAVAVATVAVIVVSSRGQASPATNLGNQEFSP